MKEILKSKYLILFTVFVLGVTYFNSLKIEKLNNQNIENNEFIINK
jgi:hypothetical protein